MKTTDREQLKNVILLCLKRGRMTTEDRQKISRFIPVRSYSYTILSLMNGGIDAEKIVEDFEKLTNDEQKKILNVCTPQPEDDTPPRKLTRDERRTFGRYGSKSTKRNFCRWGREILCRDYSANLRVNFWE